MSTSKPESSGPPLRALAMVLISLAILFAGLGFASLGDSDSDDTAVVATSSSAATSAPTGSAAARTTAPAGGTAGTASPTSSATRTSVDPASVPVRVLNNSTVTGLAGQTATKLTSAGWTVSETGNYRDGTISETTVYYGTSAGEKEAATEIADLLGVSAEPRFAGIKDSAPGVIVIVTSTG
ncbi:MAG: LytR C-terminal domain-containing protein [Rhodococcus sp. (in: high G+C Gram-positive bacteria)]|uniref:LytR C-terminal domain-containing protein n=1 Tax=Rhodococcus sp. TaxID=1831 RepID=UPI003BAE987D